MKANLSRVGALVGVIAVLAWPPCATAEPNGPDVPGVPGGPSAPAVPGPGGPPMGPGGPGAPMGPGLDVPAAPPRPALDAGAIPLSDLGGNDNIWFSGRSNTSSAWVSFTVPRGLVPTTLNATLEVPVPMRSGFLSVTQNGRTLSRLPLPAEDRPGLAIPLTGLEVSGDWVSIGLTVTAQPVQDGWCWDPISPIRLVNSSISFTGNPAPPTTVATFLPPNLRKVTIAVPPKPSDAETSAAVQLAAAMATRYGWQDNDISVVPLDAAGTLPESAFGERQIIVKEGPDKGVSLLPKPGTPALLISGTGDELTNQTRLLTDPSLDFALSTKAVAGPLVTEQKPANDTVTLTELKQGAPQDESLSPEVSIKIDQTRWGQPIGGIKVHVIGSNTPMPANFNGEILAEIDNEVIDRWALNPEGTIDHLVTIPNRLVNRSFDLRIREHLTGDPGHCNDFVNPQLRLDGDTEIQVEPVLPPLPPGFRSLPQAFGSTVQIGIGPDRMRDTIRAAQIIVGLQRNSAMPLLTKITTVEEAIASQQSAILISADGWTDQSIALPFSSNLGSIAIEGLNPEGGAVTMTLDPSIKYGSLQTVYDGQRSLLVATSNNAPFQLDELLRWVSSQQGKWGQLEGRALISAPFQAPVTVPNSQSELAADDTDSGDGGLGQNWILWLGAGIAAVAALGALGIVLRSRKPRTVAGPDPDRPSDEDDDRSPGHEE